MPSLPRIAALWLAAALTAAAAFVIAEPPDEKTAPEAVIERFEIAKGGTLLLLPVELKGKKLLFALDTGASSCIYDVSLVPLLGEPTGTGEVRT